MEGFKKVVWVLMALVLCCGFSVAYVHNNTDPKSNVTWDEVPSRLTDNMVKTLSGGYSQGVVFAEYVTVFLVFVVFCYFISLWRGWI